MITASPAIALKTRHEASVMSRPLLEVSGISKYYPIAGRGAFGGERSVKAVDNISFTVKRGETLGLVGESGCGKSTTARLILRLVEATAGKVFLDEVDVFACTRRELRELRRQMQLVFQDPLSSLNPRMSIGVNITEPLRFHRVGNARERADDVRAMLEVVGLQSRDFDRYPHELSGGQCQRVAIARALILKPKLIVFDEPVSALDVSIRAQILMLLLELQEKFALTYIFISHDLSVVKRVSNRIAVMYLGKIVEIADSETLRRTPKHPYTGSLMQAIPLPDPRQRRVDSFQVLEGDLPTPSDPPSGCRFHTRCPHRMAVCAESEPELKQLSQGHVVACLLHVQPANEEESHGYTQSGRHRL
jgi:oligopeptide transport system ATP-binding protein